MTLCECGCGGTPPTAKQTYKSRGWIKGQPTPFIRGHRVHPKSDHSLSNINKELRTAICSVCGTVNIKENGSSAWVCVTRVAEKMARYHHKHYPSKRLDVLEKNRKSRLWVFYRLTSEEQKQIENFQREHPVYSLLLGKLMGTDHCHKTGLIRGMLDWRINRACGLIEKVDPENASSILRALAEFLDNPPATLALRKKSFGLIGTARYKKKMVYGSENGPLPIEKKKKRKRK